MVNNDPFDILHRHKKKITCDLCGKRFWYWQKAIRSIPRTKDDLVWVEYYHLNCLLKSGLARKLKKEKAGRWDDNNKDDKDTSNMVH